MRTLYDMIADAVEEKAKAEKFLNEGIADKTLIRLKNGTIRPRYCQYCAENYNLKKVPKIQGWEFNLSDKEIEIIMNAYEHDKYVYRSFWSDVDNNLKRDGYDTSKLNFILPWLAKGRQYACFCDICGICSGWYFTQKDAISEFDRIVQEQILYTREFDYQKRSHNE